MKSLLCSVALAFALAVLPIRANAADLCDCSVTWTDADCLYEYINPVQACDAQDPADADLYWQNGVMWNDHDANQVVAVCGLTTFHHYNNGDYYWEIKQIVAYVVDRSTPNDVSCEARSRPIYSSTPSTEDSGSSSGNSGSSQSIYLDLDVYPDPGVALICTLPAQTASGWSGLLGLRVCYDTD